MQKTSIEWVKNPDGSQGYTSNPISGCENHTPEGLCLGGLFPCYAYKLANGRLRKRYLANGNFARPNIDRYKNPLIDPFYPRFWEERLIEGIYELGRKPKGIFVCDMGELFGDWIPDDWIKKILAACKVNPEHRFYLLTKQPQNLIKFSPFPENAWVGVTCTNQTMVLEATNHLYNHRIAKTQFLSVEPLLSWDTSHFSRPLTDSISKLDIDWLIIGACTGTKKEMEELCKRYPDLTLMSLCIDVDRRNRYIKKWTAQPNIEWVREIVEAADKAGVKVFLKDNLKPLVWGSKLFENAQLLQHISPNIIERPLRLRQELPVVK